MPPTIPHDAPFSPSQRAWLNGFLAGLGSFQDVDPCALGLADTAAPALARPVQVLFGSQTGTAEGLAKKAAKALTAQGFTPTVRDLDDASPDELADAEHVLVVTSTYGDGEMPDNAQSFWDDLSSSDAPRLEATAFAVLALGDSSYPDFCQAGIDLDARLDALGARRLVDRVDCDVDPDEGFAAWLDAVTAALAAEPEPVAA